MAQSHESIASTWTEWEVLDGKPTRVIVVATWLELDSSKPGFNSGETDDVIEAALRANGMPSTTRVRLVPAQHYNALSAAT